jgi:hypothetical protein
MKQTAVEWLVQQIETGKIEIVYSDKIHSIRCLPEFVKAAIEMEKQQIIEAHGLIAKLQEDGSHKLISGETYYNETYKKP